MLTVFQLLLSLVTHQAEDDRHNATNEPAQDNQLEQTRSQSENTEETNPTSGNQDRLDLSNDAATTPEGRWEAANEESKVSDVVQPIPTVAEANETEPEAPGATTEVGQVGAFETDTSLAASATDNASEGSSDDVDADTLPPSEPERDITAELASEVIGAPDSIVANAIETVEHHNEAPPVDASADGGAPEIPSQASEIIDSAAPESFEIAEALATASSESAGSEKESPGTTTETPFSVDVREEGTATVPDEATSSHATDVQPGKVSEIDSQTSETNIPTAMKSPVETEVVVTDQSEPAALEQEMPAESIETPLGFGVIDEIHNFADTSSSSRTQGAEQVVANSQDSACGVAKPAIAQQPREGDVARSEHQLSLPQLESKDRLILHFSIGLRDGIDSEGSFARRSGVRFAIEISGERHFEGVATESKWNEHLIDLSGHAGKEIQVTFLTVRDERRDRDNNSALWGNPRILKLTLISSAVEKSETEPTAIKGLVIGSFNDMKPTGENGTSVGVGESADGPNGELSVEEFACESPTPVSQISDGISQRMVAEAQTRGFSIGLPSQEFGVAVYAELPKLELSVLGLNTALVTVSEDFEVQCTLRNTGMVALSPANQASAAINRVKLRRGRHVYPIKTLDAGDETKLVWNLRRFSRESTAQISVSLKYQTPLGEVRQTLETVIEIRPAAPKVPSQVVPDLHTHSLQEHVVLGNKHLRLLFVQGTRGFEYFTLFAARHGSYRQTATSHAMTTIRYRNSKSETEQLRIIPTIYGLAGNSLGESIVILSGEQKDADGVNWRFETRFSLTEHDKCVRTEYSLSTSSQRELCAFYGPTLHAGDHGYGEAKTAALFPGLEFLGTDEPSSNSRDVVPPYNNRLVPHPYKITVPLMAVEYKKTLLGLAWNPLQTWDGEHTMLSAVFASPNSHDKQQNHLMGLFVPAAGNWVKENCLEASTPYSLRANRKLTISAHIIIDGNASISDAVSHWTDAYGVPEPLAPPRSDEEQLALSRNGFMHATRNEARGDSRKVLSSAAANLPSIATLMWYDYLATREDGAKRLALTPTGVTIQEPEAGGQIVPATHVTLNWELPFYLGNVESGLERIEETARTLIETQEDDGRWRYHATTDSVSRVGGNGETVLGICAHFAFVLLKHARISGNENSLNAGLKALKGMDRFKVPRGALASECPLKTPYLLAAAYAVGAYVEAHAITDDKRHLERAEHWAKSGLAFIYHWNLPDRPAMRFASVPMFGATSETRSWFGVPSQWSGLVFAYHLQHLARYSQRGNWTSIAEGILHSGMHQQWTEGEFRGTYPDSLHESCTEGRAPYISPENIMANLYTLRGQDPDISTAIIRHENGRIHLSSGAQIETCGRHGNGTLHFKLGYVDNETSHTIITGYGSIPSAVKAHDQDVPCVEDLEAAESGWLYRQEKDIVFVKFRHIESEITFEVLPSPEEESPKIDEHPQEQLTQGETSSSNTHDEATAETPESEE